MMPNGVTKTLETWATALPWEHEVEHPFKEQPHEYSLPEAFTSISGPEL